MLRLFSMACFIAIIAQNAWGVLSCENCSAADGLYGCADHEGCFPCPENSICPGSTGYPRAYNTIYCKEGYFATGDRTNGTMQCHKCPDSVYCPERTTIENLPCSIGLATLHVADYEFNVYADVCPSPAIRLRIDDNDTTCCVPLKIGNGSGLNLIYDKETYHTINWFHK